MTSHIVARVMRNLEQIGNQTAIYFGDEVISGTAFLSQITRYRNGLLAQDRHEVVALSLKTTPAALALYLASLSLAQNTIYLDANWPRSTTTKILSKCRPDIVVSDHGRVAPNAIAISNLALANESNREVTSNTIPNYTCFTSGSTGLPKGCVRSETSWIESFAADQEFTQITSSSIVVAPGSFAHSLFLYAAIRGLYAGAKVAIFASFNPNRIVGQMLTFENVIVFGVPTQLEALASASHAPLTSVKRVLSTGSKLPSSFIETFTQKMPNATFVEFYGTSELSYVAAREALLSDSATNVGTPLTDVHISIRDIKGQLLPKGYEGLVYVKSPMAFKGYLGEEDTDAADEWLSVGDTGFLASDNNLHLVGRFDRLFQSSGRNIVPEVVEAALLSIEGVNLAAVLGEPDSTRENRVVAVINADCTLSKNDILLELKKTLVTYTIPTRFYQSDPWPRTVAGKTDLVTLKRQLINAELGDLF